MAEMLASISTVLSAILGWVGIVSEKVSTNPVLLIVVLLSFLGTGVLLFKRLLGMR
jgi:multisubunit Na+/H+ antiporter MnhF subunit